MSTTFTREDLLVERQTGVGGSDIGRLLSLEPYGCARQLWLEKRGAEQEFEPFEAGILERGNALEPIVAEMYAKKTGRRLEVDPKAVHHSQHSELLVHMDRIIVADGRVEPGVLEIKTAGRDVYFKMKREGLPESYILQLQHAMSVTGAQWGAFAVLWPDGWQLLHWDVERDEELIELITAEALKFWGLVENGPAPDRLDVDDPRCGKCPYQIQCQGSAMQDLMKKQGIGTMRDESLAPLAAEYIEARAAEKQAEEWKKGAGEELATALGDRVDVQTSAGNVKFNPFLEWDEKKIAADMPGELAKFRVKVDWTAFGNAHPELEKSYKRVGTKRPLRVFAPKKK